MAKVKVDRLQFLVDQSNENISQELQLSKEAGDIIDDIYKALLNQFKGNITKETLHSMNVFCVRLVFCYYAEDSELFKNHLMFGDYLARHKSSARDALKKLFNILDTPEGERDPYEDKDLLEFPYVNGGLFEGEVILPRLTDEIVAKIIKGSQFDWSDISPTIFGALFEATLNPVIRRSKGMHYTSIENIHKVIGPLFLNDLTEELKGIIQSGEGIKTLTVKGKFSERTLAYRRKLDDFRTKLSSLKIFDPACGSGNFLTESYICLRRLENEAIKEIHGSDQLYLTDDDEFKEIVKVKIEQFYGLEINDFAVSVANTALWIAEHQMLRETRNIVGKDLEMLPLRSKANIERGNALRVEWKDFVEPTDKTFIIGNPPFVGARLMLSEKDEQALQKSDIRHVFQDWKYKTGDLDYVSCWFKRASDYMKGTKVHTALVATNSITQGDAVQPLWQQLFEDGLKFDFAHRTFRWDSEANSKAHVHCVIIGCSHCGVHKDKRIISVNGRPLKAQHINAYLRDEEDWWIPCRTKSICGLPRVKIGNKPIDNGNYLFKEAEMEEFIREEPASEEWFRLWYGADEFINNRPKYCLFLQHCPLSELRKMPLCRERIQNVRAYRLASESEGTRKLAETPLRFHVENFPTAEFLVIPETSSEQRPYVPMGYMSPDVLCSNAIRILPNATLYQFGVLTSNVHMAWMRAIAGRLKSDYRYSIGLVYNNFPLPKPTPEQIEKIEQTAKKILDARSLIFDTDPNLSYAGLYDDLLMPPELKEAHQLNDLAVMEAYGFGYKMSESEVVRELMKLLKQAEAEFLERTKKKPSMKRKGKTKD